MLTLLSVPDVNPFTIVGYHCPPELFETEKSWFHVSMHPGHWSTAEHINMSSGGVVLPDESVYQNPSSSPPSWQPSFWLHMCSLGGAYMLEFGMCATSH
jgi:hypothetical protein